MVIQQNSSIKTMVFHIKLQGQHVRFKIIGKEFDFLKSLCIITDYIVTLFKLCVKRYKYHVIARLLSSRCMICYSCKFVLSFCFVIFKFCFRYQLNTNVYNILIYKMPNSIRMFQQKLCVIINRQSRKVDHQQKVTNFTNYRSYMYLSFNDYTLLFYYSIYSVCLMPMIIMNYTINLHVLPSEHAGNAVKLMHCN